MYEIERKWLFTSTEVPKDVEMIGRVVYSRDIYQRWFGEEVTYNDYYKMRNYWRRIRE